MECNNYEFNARNVFSPGYSDNPKRLSHLCDTFIYAQNTIDSQKTLNPLKNLYTNIDFRDIAGELNVKLRKACQKISIYEDGSVLETIAEGNIGALVLISLMNRKKTRPKDFELYFSDDLFQPGLKNYLINAVRELAHQKNLDVSPDLDKYVTDLLNFYSPGNYSYEKTPDKTGGGNWDVENELIEKTVRKERGIRNSLLKSGMTNSKELQMPGESDWSNYSTRSKF